MTAPTTTADRTVVWLFASRTRDRGSARHARRTTGHGRHSTAAGQQTTALQLVRGEAKHSAPLPRARSLRTRSAHATLTRTDRVLFRIAGWMLAVRIAFVGENFIAGP